MKNKPKGNQKHLTLSQRIEIEKSLLIGENFAAIARKLSKDSSTISKEIRRHSMIKERKNTVFASIPCNNRKGCTIKYLCNELCETICTYCPKTEMKCIYVCPNYEPKTCKKLNKPPYVCNGCGKRSNCLMEMKVYSSKYADDGYRELLVSSREGINQTPDSIMKMDKLLSPLIQKGQSIAHIYSHHAQEIGCSRRTLYNYIDQSVLTVRNLDLRRRVKYKQRKTSTRASTKNHAYRDGRDYSDFQKLIKEKPHLNVVEMDTVEGLKGGKVFLTMMFRNCSLMLIFLLESKTQEAVQQVCVTEVYDYLSNSLGVTIFKKLFPVILTDNGTEFQLPARLECDEAGAIRTKIFFCNPNCSWQKGMLEKNHEYIRYVIPKGQSLDSYSWGDAQLLMNHINSEARDSLNSHNPFQLSLILLDNKLHKLLGIKEIPSDEVQLRPSLLK